MALTRRQSRLLASKQNQGTAEKLTDESSQIAGTKPASRPEVPIETEISHDSTQEQLDGKVEHSNDQTAEEEAEKNDSQTLEGSDNTSDHEGNEEQKVDDENDEQPSDEEQSDEEQSDEEQSDEEQSEEEQSEEEQSEEEQSDEDDLEKLLNNAQEALSKQKQFEEVEMQEDDDAKRAFLIPKLNTGINVYDQLYIKKEKGLARLVEDSVALVEEDNQGPLKSRQAVVLKESKIEGKRLSRKERQQEREKTAGKGWFDMPKPEMTPEMKRDLQVLKMRHVIDPKRHYKKFGKGEDPKYFQTGTIIEGPTEFFSSRINRKDRKQTFVDELLADETARSYHKRKHLEAQSRGRNGRKKMKREMKRL